LKTPKILLLSFYYPPDLSAGSFRASALVDALLAERVGRLRIDVITTQPSRYGTYSPAALGVEAREGLTIRRVILPKVRRGILGQVLLFIHFAWGAWRLSRGQQYDVVVATSSRLMTAVLGALLALDKRAQFYVDIRDIFVETLAEAFPSRLFRPLHWVFSGLEKFCLRRANKVNLVSPGFLPYFQPRYPDKVFSLFPNGVDAEFNKPLAGINESPPRPLRIVYAGNIGDGQGLHYVIPALAARLREQAHFLVVGDGGRIAELEMALSSAGVDNVELLKPVKRSVLLNIYRDADILFLHLNDFKAFRRVLPSKLFEYAASSKPIWAGVAGYAADFIRQEVPNAAVFAPCDIESALGAFKQLSLQPTLRDEFVQRFSRQRIMQAMAKDVLALSAPESV
jgi:glycosyltransferase involved in cell wall biosynthesis